MSDHERSVFHPFVISHVTEMPLKFLEWRIIFGRFVSKAQVALCPAVCDPVVAL